MSDIKLARVSPTRFPRLQQPVSLPYKGVSPAIAGLFSLITMDLDLFCAGVVKEVAARHARNRAKMKAMKKKFIAKK